MGSGYRLVATPPLPRDNVKKPQVTQLLRVNSVRLVLGDDSSDSRECSRVRNKVLSNRRPVEVAKVSQLGFVPCAWTLMAAARAAFL